MIPTVPTPFAVAPYLKEIGRGKDGARGLPRERAHELMAAILAGAVSDLALGAVLIALRMKGEEAAEIAGFLDAIAPVLRRAPRAQGPADRGWVVIPSYNGARSIANLVPLLAMLLAREGTPVLIHGQPSEPEAGRRRVTTEDIFRELGVPGCATPEDAAQRRHDGLPAVLTLESVCPPLARLIDLRRTLGVRNVGHTLAKLICPVEGPSLLITSYTHPHFRDMKAELFTMTGTHAMAMRATDGESVVNARRPQSVERWFHGTRTTVLAGEPVARADLELPGMDAAATARWTRDVLDGRIPVPTAIRAQADVIATAVKEAAAT